MQRGDVNSSCEFYVPRSSRSTFWKLAMEQVGFGSAAIVTGGGSGIGRALCLALAERGATVTVVERNESDGMATVKLIEAVHAKLGVKPVGPSALFSKCDVSSPEQLFASFSLHEVMYGKLDVLVNNAAIGDKKYFSDDFRNDSTADWRTVMDIDLMAVIDCTRLGIQMLKRLKRPGVIVNVGSAAGLYPSTISPIYSAAKAGVVMFTRALGHLRFTDGIRVNVFCPEHVETNLTKNIPADKLAHVVPDGYIPMKTILAGIFELIDDETRGGDCLWVTNRRGAEYWPSPEEEAKYLRTKTKPSHTPTSVLSPPDSVLSSRSGADSP